MQQQCAQQNNGPKTQYDVTGGVDTLALILMKLHRCTRLPFGYLPSTFIRPSSLYAPFFKKKQQKGAVFQQNILLTQGIPSRGRFGRP